MRKIFCYVDETGQDTQGELFLVSVVTTEEEREDLLRRLEEIEKMTRKGRRKWLDTRDEVKLDYMNSVLSQPAFKDKLAYAIYHNTTNYLSATVLTTARAITRYGKQDYKATVFIDGLQKTLVPWVGAELRHLHIRTTKVRGVRNEEANALMRLADAVCGFVRAALSRKGELSRILEQAKAQGYIREL